MSKQDKCKRKVWTREETLGLLKCYSARKDEFFHSRKKIYAYSNVLEDMICQGIVNSSITAFALEGKMRSLLKAYKRTKDSVGQTGSSARIEPYMEEMYQIFGDRPIVYRNPKHYVRERPVLEQKTLMPKSTQESGNKHIISNNHTLHIGRGPVLALEQETTLPKITQYQNEFEIFMDDDNRSPSPTPLVNSFSFGAGPSTCQQLKQKAGLDIKWDKDVETDNGDPLRTLIPSPTMLQHLNHVKQEVELDSWDKNLETDYSPQSKPSVVSNFSYAAGASTSLLEVKQEAELNWDNDMETDDTTQSSPLMVTGPSISTPTCGLSSLSFESASSRPMNINKKRTTRDAFLEARLKMKKDAIKVKESQRELYFKRMMDSLELKWKKELEIEEKKLALLERLVKK